MLSCLSIEKSDEHEAGKRIHEKLRTQLIDSLMM
jgi:hypothetical protein